MPGLFEGFNQALDQSSQRNLRQAQIDAAAQEQAGQSAAGGALSQIAMPGATQMPNAQPQTPLQMLGAGLKGLVGHLQGQPQQQGASGQPQPQQQSPQGQPGGPVTIGRQQPQQQQNGGRLDWRQIVQALKTRDPTIDNATLFQAVNQSLPIMNQESQAEWKQIALGLAQQRANTGAAGEQERARHDVVTEGQGEQRIGQGDERIGQGQQKINIQQQQWAANQKRLMDNFKTRGDVIVQKLQAAKTKEEAAQGFREMEALKKEAHQATVTQIQAANSLYLDDDTKKQLIADAKQKEKDATDQIDQMKKKINDRLASGGATLGGDGGFSSNMQPTIPNKRDMVIQLRNQGEQMQGQERAGSGAAGQVGGQGAKPQDSGVATAQAAIDRGAPYAQVVARAKQSGVDVSLLKPKAN